MNKRFKTLLISFCLFSILAFPAITLAQESMQGLLNTAGSSAGYNTDEEWSKTGLATIVGYVVRSFVSLLGIIFICYVIYGGYLWMTAAGNDEKITKARKIIVDGIIGLVIVLSAVGIYYLISNFFINPGTPTTGYDNWGGAN